MEQREYFTFFRSYYEAFSMLSPRVRLELYDALCEFMFNGVEKELGKTASSHWKLIKPILESNNKNRDNALKTGRGKKSAASAMTDSAGDCDVTSNKEKEKDKDMDRDKGKGIPGASLPGRSLKRKGTSPAEPVFQSLPGSLERLGYAATEDLKKRRIKELEQATQHTTSRPVDDDAETRRLKQRFMQQLNPVPVAAPETPLADTGTAAASTQTPAHGADQSAAPTLEAVQAPQPSGDPARDQTDTGPAGQEITAQPVPQHPPEESPAASTVPGRCQFGTT